MNWKIPTTLYDPDDAGGQGGDDVEQPAKIAEDPNAGLKAVADSIRSAILEAKSTPAPIVPVAPVGASDATRRALEAEGAEVNARVDELIAAGKGAEALSVRDAFINKANRLTASDPADSVVVKTAIALGERAARTEHKAIMDKWPDEVRRAVDAMPLEERVLPNAWDNAVARVRSNHFDELMAEGVAAGVAEERKKFVPPPSAPGSRGSRPLEGPAARLTEEQLWGADVSGVDPDVYAKEFAREERFDKLPFKERAKFPGYPVIDDPRGNSTVAPGKF